MKSSINWILLSSVLLWSLVTYGQDSHFSQYYASPLNLNPSLTGLIDGSYRVNAIYRDQWRSIVDQPITTFSFSGDLRFLMNDRTNNNPDYIGGGINFFTDRTGTFGLNLTKISLSAAFHKALDKRLNQYLSAGLSFGINQRNVGYGALNFEDEFNGINDYNLNTGEVLPPNNLGYVDIGLGLMYSIQPNEGLKMAFGFSMDHLNSPKASFFNESIDNPEFQSDITIPSKLQLHANVESSISESLLFLPRILFTKQGESKEFTVGSNFKFNLLKTEGKAFYLGTALRMVSRSGNSQLTDLILFTGFDFNGKLLGISYDANLGDLTNQFSGQGSFEITFSYIGNYENESHFCPEF